MKGNTMKKTVQKKNSPNTKSKMFMNVILTFETANKFGETQEFFDLYLPIDPKEKNAVDFIHRKLFGMIVNKCRQLKRPLGDLTKISSAGNWALFTKVTKKKSLIEWGHNGKWYFGKGRDDLDFWEKELMAMHGFGTDADMSWMKSPSATEEYLKSQPGFAVDHKLPIQVFV